MHEGSGGLPDGLSPARLIHGQWIHVHPLTPPRVSLVLPVALQVSSHSREGGGPWVNGTDTQEEET